MDKPVSSASSTLTSSTSMPLFSSMMTETEQEQQQQQQQQASLDVLLSTTTNESPKVTTNQIANTKNDQKNRNRRQVLEFVEPTTNVTVVLIGSMHYNPASIDLVKRTVDQLGDEQKLGSVIIESCDIRWNKTQEIIDKKQQKQQQSSSSSSSSSRSNTITPNTNDNDFLGNEMRAAWEIASLQYQRPTVLGDQRINITVNALQQSLKDTARDLLFLNPNGINGWKNTYNEIQEGWSLTTPIDFSSTTTTATASSSSPNNKEGQDQQGLTVWSFFDPRLLLALPVSLVKYPLSFLVKDPIPFTVFFGAIFGLNYYADHTTTSSIVNAFDVSFNLNNNLDEYATALTTGALEQQQELTVYDYFLSLVVAILETIVFARLLLKPLLAERNEILAKSILDQCQIYASSSSLNALDNNNNNNNGRNNRFIPKLFSSFFFPIFGDNKDNNNNNNKNSGTSSLLSSSSSSSLDNGIIYVPGCSPLEMNGENGNKENDDGGKVVVAVLGMAHCNGIMKLLREQRVS